MTYEIHDDESKESLIRELKELKLRLRKSESEKEELAKCFLNQCDRIEILKQLQKI